MREEAEDNISDEDIRTAFDDDALTDDFLDGKKDFIKKAKGTADLAALGGHLQSLIGGIKPGMFKEGVDVGQLTSMAGSLKSIADATGLMSKLQNGLLEKAFKKGWSGKKSDKFNKALEMLG
jgi:hypothetical protein